MNQRLLCAGAIVLLTALSLAGFVYVSERYPFYFIWDMDHTAALDLLLINNGLLPDHINHTGLGMYLLTRLTSLVSWTLGTLSTLHFETVAAALNPLLPIAEFTTFVRLNSPVVIVAGALATFAGVQWAARVPLASVAGIAVLAALLSQSWQVYHSAMVRTEVYAVFFWQLALFAIFLTVRSRSGWTQMLLALISGLMLGVAFITKFQLFPYLIAFYFITKAVFDLHEDRFEAIRQTTALPAVVIGLNILAILIFAVILLLAWQQPLASGYYIVSEDGHPPTYWPNFAALSFFAIGILLIVFAIAQRWLSVLARLSGSHDLVLFSMVQLGYACASGVAFVVFANLTERSEFVLANFKVAYLRQFVGGGFDATVATMRNNVSQLIDNYRILLILLAIAIALTVALALLSPESSERKKCVRLAVWTLGAIGIFLIGSVFFRFIVRDMIWHETLPTLLLVLLLATAGGVIRHGRPDRHGGILAAAVTAVPLVIITMVNVYSVPTILLKADLNYNIYGWSPEHAFLPVYVGNHQLYATVTQAHFPDRRVEPHSYAGIAFRHATEWRTLARTAEFVLPYHRVPLTAIGVFAQGATATSRLEKLANVPNGFEGAALLDLRVLPARVSNLLDANLVSDESEAFDKVTDKKATDRIGIVPRADLDIFLFSERSQESTPCEIVTTLQATERLIEFCGRRVQKYLELPADRSRRDLLTVRPKFGW
jgi:hypothetical protein